MAIEHTHQRVTWADGTWADVNTVHIPASERLVFRRVKVDGQPLFDRLRDIGDMWLFKGREKGLDQHTSIIWALNSPYSRTVHVFPTIEPVTDDGEYILDAGSYIQFMLRKMAANGWLREEMGVLQADVADVEWRAGAEAVVRHLANLPQRALIAGDRDLTTLDPMRDIVRLGGGIPLRHDPQTPESQAAFNTAFFLLEHEDWISHHSSLGSAHGFAAAAYGVFAPPLYNRAAIWQSEDGTWRIDRLNMKDIDIVDFMVGQEAPSPLSQRPPAINPQAPSEIAIYTRYYGVETTGRVLGRTPKDADRIEFSVVGQMVCGYKWGGDLLIPQDGFIISIARAMLPNMPTMYRTSDSTKLRYKFKREGSIISGVQGGPILLRNGDIALDEHTAEREQIWGSREIDGEWVVGVVPTDWNAAKASIGSYRAARTAIGIKAGGDRVVVQIDGVNTGMGTKRDSVGATLLELCEQLLQAGAVDAINLDGGGSATLFVHGGMMSRPADRRGRPGIYYDRLVPSVGVVV